MEKALILKDLELLKYIYFLTKVKNLGNIKIKKILSVCPDMGKFSELSKNELKKIPGIDEVIATGLIKSMQEYDIVSKEFDEFYEKARAKNINIISIFSEEYPENLKNIYDAPIVLYYKGNLTKDDRYSISVVGTRYPTEYGKNICARLIGGLSELKIPIISGFAKGIDSAGHKASLRAENITYAVFGCGVDIIYPAENKNMYGEIVEKGAVISEYEPGMYPDKVNFPTRNRIISGISLGTIVVESGLKGGSLLTAGFALDQGKEIFAVPGQANSKQSEGTNELIKRGQAKLVTSVEDIVSELEQKLKKFLSKTDVKEEEKTIKDLKAGEQKIFSLLNHEPVNIDRINEETGLSISECLVNLLSLEFKGLIKQIPGKNFMRT